MIRKKRSATAPATPRRQGENEARDLLSQDDSIPGNRKDGFRFHYLTFAMIATPLYLWLELSFGVRLLDHMSGSVTQEDIDSIEHWGRLISGCAVSLLFLTQWFGQCEKWDRPWWLRLTMAFAIVAICVPLTWMAQSRLIDFYVKQGRTEIMVAVPLLIVMIGLGLFAIRLWLKTYGQRRTAKPAITIGVLVAMAMGLTLAVIGISRAVPVIVGQFVPAEILNERLGKERQQAATLALIKKGLQLGVYTLSYAQSKDLTKSVVESPEGKTSMSMFPVLGSAMDQQRFIADQPRVLKEVMYLDWDREAGGQAYTGYQEIVNELRAIYEGDYQKAGAKPANWTSTSKALFDGNLVAPGLSEEDFAQDAGVSRFLARRMACFDCQFHGAMDRLEFTYELFLGTQMHNYNTVLTSLEDPKHFETGKDGEAAARMYWVPIWALLFSMIGAFTHIFKLSFTVAEYANLRTFAKVHAADSRLSNDVIDNTRRVLLTLMAAVMVFIYFSENRVTGTPTYPNLHQRMWEQNPLVGGLAAHWTINAQALIYPFTRKTTPEWLVFNDDPFDHFPLSLFSSWVREDWEGEGDEDMGGQ
jgi:hypothetical protein